MLDLCYVCNTPPQNQQKLRMKCSLVTTPNNTRTEVQRKQMKTFKLSERKQKKLYQADQRVVSTNTQVLQALLIQAFCILFSEPRQHLNSPCCLLKQFQETYGLLEKCRWVSTTIQKAELRTLFSCFLC